MARKGGSRCHDLRTRKSRKHRGQKKRARLAKRGDNNDRN